MVITGASGGIGAATAERIGRDGARVVLIARREPELRAVAARCAGAALPVPADVTRRAEVARARDAAIAAFGHIDVWINNAGRGITRPVSQLTDADFDDMMRINVKSALYGMQELLPHFRERGRGHWINVSSALGRIPYVHLRSAYSAAKHALNALTASFRMELGQEFPGIHVSTVSPGVVSTEFGIRALGGGPDSRTLPNAQPVEEVAEVIADLIEHPRADVYTRPGIQDQVVAYYSAADMGQAESAPPFFRLVPKQPA